MRFINNILPFWFLLLLPCGVYAENNLYTLQKLLSGNDWHWYGIGNSQVDTKLINTIWFTSRLDVLGASKKFTASLPSEFGLLQITENAHLLSGLAQEKHWLAVISPAKNNTSMGFVSVLSANKNNFIALGYSYLLPSTSKFISASNFDGKKLQLFKVNLPLNELFIFIQVRAKENGWNINSKNNLQPVKNFAANNYFYLWLSKDSDNTLQIFASDKEKQTVISILGEARGDL